jgi:raffinose/stachyose/melibiose transport system substrate-binding protein
MGIHLRVLSVLVLLSVVAVGCVVPTVTPAPEAPAEATEAPAPAEEPAEVSEPEEVTLQVWDIWGRDEESKVIETLHGEFEEAHPGVSIERTVKSFEDMKATAKLGLSNPDGPDVAQINQGESDMGALVKAGLLKDLTPYAEQYGWYDKFSQGLVARNSFTPDAEQFGEGNFYGIAPTAEFVGVYYRKDIFDELGLEVPETVTELEAAMDAIKEAGYVPVAFGNLDGWPMFHIHGEFQNVLIPDRYYLDNIMYAWEPGTWNTPENVEAAAKVQEWVEKEYLTPGFEGISYDDSTALFDSGEGAMMITGSWMSSTFAAGPHGENIGFFLFPPAEEGQNKLAIGGTSTSYAIREDSPNADLAAEYIDLMMSDRAAELWVESATVPVVPVDPGALEEGTLFTDLVKAWAQMNANDAVGHYTDWATPTFYDTYSAAGQELMGLQITPEEFVEKLQADYAAYHGYEE